MPVIALKLKQASAVLRVPPKDLQNLAQFKVIRPRRKAGLWSMIGMRFMLRASPFI